MYKKFEKYRKIVRLLYLISKNWAKIRTKCPYAYCVWCETPTSQNNFSDSKSCSLTILYDSMCIPEILIKFYELDKFLVFLNYIFKKGVSVKSTQHNRNRENLSKFLKIWRFFVIYLSDIQDIFSSTSSILIVVKLSVFLHIYIKTDW